MKRISKLFTFMIFIMTLLSTPSLFALSHAHPEAPTSTLPTLPDKARILTCPHCGGKKEIMNLLSGNTIGARLWSDNKQVAPMLPSPSAVQKCPHCKHFYLLSRQTDAEYGEDYSNELGTLTYKEIKKALKESADWNMNQEEKLSVRLLLLWTYNDKYTRGIPTEEQNIPKKEEAYINENIDTLLTLVTDHVFKAELFRERGKFEECIQELKLVDTKEKFIESIVSKMSKKAKAKDKTLWRIY